MVETPARRTLVPSNWEQAAEALNDRLVEAEKYFAALPNKISTEIEVDGRRIGLDRVSNEWRLLIVVRHEGEDFAITWDRCSLEDRALLAIHLNDLLMHVRRNGTRRRVALTKAHRALDEFEAKIRDPKGGN